VVGFTPAVGFTPFSGTGHRLTVEKKELTEAEFELLFPEPTESEIECCINDSDDDGIYSYEPNFVALDVMD
jgi:hypothetical protein